jgi:hypothetical protein
MFCQSVQHHPQIAKTLESYDQAHPNPKNHTFMLITAHVRTQLPPILSAAGAIAGKAFTVMEGNQAMTHAELAVAYAALSAQEQQRTAGTKRLSGAAKRARGKRNRNQRGGEGEDKTAQKRTAGSSGKCEYYCYLHGGQNSHTSAQC